MTKISEPLDLHPCDLYQKLKRPTIASLFSGGGLVEVGAIASGFQPIWGVEFNPDKPELSRAIADCYETNIGAHVIRQKVQDVNWSQLQSPDLLWASPVCTRMSGANLNRGESSQDVELAMAIASAISILQPKAFCLENVRAYAKSRSLQLIRDTLHRLGYSIDEVVIDAADYGVPQSRVRFILRAVKGQVPPTLPSIVSKQVGWYEAVADLIPTLPVGDLAPWQRQRLSEQGFAPDFPQVFLIEGRNINKWGNQYRSAEQPARTITADSFKGLPRVFLIERGGARSDRPLLVRGSDEPAWTLRASIGTDQNGNNRNAVMNVLLESGRVLRLTPRALARLQTLPDSYWLPAEMKIACPLIGNGVPCQLVQVILAGIKPLLLINQNFTFFDFQEVKHHMVAVSKTIQLTETIQHLQSQEQQLRSRLDNLHSERKNLKECQKVEKLLTQIVQRWRSLEAYSQLSPKMRVGHPQRGIGVITSLTLSPGGMPEAWVRWSDSSVSVPEQPLNLLENQHIAENNTALLEELEELDEFAANQSLPTIESTITDSESHVPADRLDRKVSESLTSTQPSVSITQYLPIADLKTGGGTQSRSELNWEVIAEYAEAMSKDAVFPPVIVFYDGENYWLCDGFHRLHATKKAGLTEIAVEIRQGSRRDAVLYSVGANANHGLRRSHADKRRAVLVLLDDPEWSQWSNREIAKQCGVDEGLVRSIKEELHQLSADNPQIDPKYVKKCGVPETMIREVQQRLLTQSGERTVERNGKTYTLDPTNIGSSTPVQKHSSPTGTTKQEDVTIVQSELESYPTSETMLSPQDLVPEPTSKDKQLLKSLPPNTDIPPNELPPTPALLTNANAIANGTRAAIATEVTIGLISNVDLLSNEQVRAVFQAIYPRIQEIGVSCQFSNQAQFP